MKKRALSLLLVLVMVFGLLSVTARADELDNGLVYEIYGDHVEITGYTGNATEVVIPAEIEGLPVTVIGEDAFSYCESLTSIDLPDSITSIGRDAFLACENLSNIDLPNSITSISNGTFRYCESLTSIVLPDSVTYIGEEAFSECYALTEIALPDALTYIGDWAFTVCDLTRIDIPKNVTYIGECAFLGCFNLTGIYVHKDNPNYSSDNCGVLFDKEKTQLIQAPCTIAAYTIPNSVTTIGQSAFDQCSNLTSIDIPNSVTYIGDQAFCWCPSLTSIDLPDHLTYIGMQAFAFCYSLTDIDIPNSVTCIDSLAFCECTSLTSIHIPASVTNLSTDAFSYCPSLTGIHVDENNPNYSSDAQGILFDKEKTELLLAPGAITTCTIPDGVAYIGHSSFAWCENLTRVTIPASVTDIFDWAFLYCENLTNISFEGDAPYMDQYVFSEVTATAYYPINNSTWTSDVMQDYDGDITWASYDPAHPHKYTPSVISPTCTERGYTRHACSCGYGYVSDYVEALGHDYNSNGICTRCGKVDDGLLYEVYENHVSITGYDGDATEIVIPAEIEGLPVTSIDESAFYWADNLTSIKLPDSVTYIGAWAFATCENLSSINIPDGVTFIGDRAFGACRGLTNISIPDSVTYIGDEAFLFCEGLTSFYIPDSVTYIGTHAFMGCYGLPGIHVDEDNPNYSNDSRGVLFDKEKTALIWAPKAISGSYAIPNSVSQIMDCAFSFCENLTSISIPAHITHIGNAAFEFCLGLTSVHFEGDAPEFGFEVFYNTTTTAYYPAGNSTWTSDVMQNCGGNLTWIGYNPDGSFYDVAMNSFYEAPVEWAVENGITTGATADTFNPNGQCLRAQVVTFLWRTAGCPEPTSTINPFVDVKQSDFYYKAVLWAVENGITNGTDATHFDPFGICNRAQVVTFLYRAQTDPQTGNTKGSFSDVADDTWYSAPIDWAASNDITNGLGDGTFGIGNPCNRAQVVTFLYRTYN